MAKKRKPTAKAGRPPKPEAEEEVETSLMLPTATLVRDLAKLKADAKQKTQRINGTLGEKIAEAVENKHVDRWSLSKACDFAKLDDETLHLRYVHFMKYMGFLGVTKRAEAQADLFEQGPESEEAGEEEATNVTSIGAAARRVTETAGEAQSA